MKFGNSSVGVKRLATFLAWACVLGPIAAQGIGRFGRMSIWLDVFNHFVPMYCLCILTGIVLAAVVRSPRIAIVGIVAILVTAPRVLYLYVPSASAGADSTEPLRIMIANVNYENRQHDHTIELIDAWGDPDILVFPEFMKRWDIALEVIEDRYPYKLRDGITDKLYGVAVYSRIPMEVVEVDVPPVMNYRYIVSVVGGVEWNGERVHLVSIHPRSINIPQRVDHIPQMRALNDLLQSLPRPVILAGDFNSTPWSPNMNDIIENNGLIDIRQGHGLQPTWPVYVPILPIDGALISDDLNVTHLEVGPNIKSDHYPLLVEIQ